MDRLALLLQISESKLEEMDYDMELSFEMMEMHPVETDEVMIVEQ
jgi:hypothetical protein